MTRTQDLKIEVFLLAIPLGLSAALFSENTNHSLNVVTESADSRVAELTRVHNLSTNTNFNTVFSIHNLERLRLSLTDDELAKILDASDPESTLISQDVTGASVPDAPTNLILGD